MINPVDEAFSETIVNGRRVDENVGKWSGCVTNISTMGEYP